MRLHSTLGSLIVVVAVAGCTSATDAAAPATVTFVLDAPLCSSVLPVQFSIDGQLVGVDTFRVALTNPHVSSRAFETPAGGHTLSAQTTFGYVWAGKNVTLSPGQAVVDSLPFYCS